MRHAILGAQITGINAYFNSVRAGEREGPETKLSRTGTLLAWTQADLEPMMAFALNLMVACLAVFGLSVLFGMAVVSLENRRSGAGAAGSREASARSAYERTLPADRARVSCYPTAGVDGDRDRNVA